MAAKATREDQQGTPGFVQRTSQHITAHQSQSGTPASVEPHAQCTNGGCGLTGTLATLLGDPHQCLLCGKSKDISPPLAPCPTTSSSRIRHRHILQQPSSLSSICQPRYPQNHTYIHIIHLLSVRPPSKLSCPLWWWKTTHIKEQLQQSTPLTLSSSASVSCLLNRRVRLDFAFYTHSQAARERWNWEAAKERGKDGSS
jgi:hypothetical protein